MQEKEGTDIYLQTNLLKKVIPRTKLSLSDPKVSQEKVWEMKHFCYDNTGCRVFKRGVQN